MKLYVDDILQTNANELGLFHPSEPEANVSPILLGDRRRSDSDDPMHVTLSFSREVDDLSGSRRIQVEGLPLGGVITTLHLDADLRQVEQNLYAGPITAGPRWVRRITDAG